MMLTLPRRKTIWLINVASASVFAVVYFPVRFVFCCICFSFCNCCCTYFISFQVEKCYHRSLEIYENKFDVDDLTVAKTLTNLVCLVCLSFVLIISLNFVLNSILDFVF